MNIAASNPLPSLDLPKRWEFLQQKADAAGLDALSVVERVEEAAKRVDALLARIRSGGGLFEVFLGASGSGKTTFVNSLPKFFDSIRVVPFPKDLPLLELPAFIRRTHVPGDDQSRIILVEKRDNPVAADLENVEPMMAELLEVFREPAGQVLVLWPVTREVNARKIAEEAWITGSDSVVDKSTKGLFQFSGVPRADYYRLADTTCRTLTGDSLEAFGVAEEDAVEMIAGSETIAMFYGSVNEAAEAIRGQTWSVLRQRVVPYLWVVLPGDSVSAVQATATELTQGTRSRIDVDLVGEFIDAPSNSSLYVEDWRARRGQLANLLRAVDLRLFSLPPNAALAAVRACGDKTLKDALKSPSVNLEAAKKTMRATRLYKAILTVAGKENVPPFAGYRAVEQETEEEYRRIQRGAKNNDKPLNKSLGGLIALCLKDDAPELEVVTEKKSLPGSQLQPDIQIDLKNGSYICLEPTWRTTGREIDGEIDKAQNTLTSAHMKKYVLDKAMQYVKDLKL
ncbi:hypothetical protein ACLBV5_11050 [Brevundimonas sp. M1A4_2e]